MHRGASVDEQRLPIACRWSLRALGTSEVGGSAGPRDGVSAWLLKQRPALAPQFAAPSILTMVRVRAEWFDARVAEHLAGGPGPVVSVGAGLDTRWSRLGGGPERFLEIEEPSVLDYKAGLLTDSPHATAWRSVTTRAVSEAEWPGADLPDARLVVLEGASTRLGGRGFRVLLARLRRALPDARLLVDIPGFLTSATGSSQGGASWEPFGQHGPAHLTREELAQYGLEIDEDLVLAGRPDLRLAFNGTRCPGMEPLRVLVLRPAVGST